MNHRKSIKGRSRDLGIPGANGKGSADRTTNRAEFSRRFDEINWSPRKPEIFAETEGEWGPDVIGIGNHAPTTDIHRE